MGRQTGAVTFTGRFGNMVGYISDGENLVRTPGGQTKSQIMSNPRTKANVDEFGLLQASVGTIRLGLMRAIAKTRNSKLQGQLTSKLSTIRNTSTQPKGERTVAEGTNFGSLQDFRISKRAMASRFALSFNANWNKATSSAELAVLDINPASDVFPPSSAAKFSYSFIAAEVDLIENRIIQSGMAVHIDKQDVTAITPIAGVVIQIPLSNTANTHIIGAQLIEFFDDNDAPLGIQDNASIISLATKNV
ncbi:hypothetical protein [uncultured Microscilla sp.]|uniref:hypothetical protein n=1 Tax=uncultured Microscilla sp. TaxID=432653 RepID=UPI002609E000|nr:hypothetical protein [uncultured Microscilla sp.]